MFVSCVVSGTSHVCVLCCKWDISCLYPVLYEGHLIFVFFFVCGTSHINFVSCVVSV